MLCCAVYIVLRFVLTRLHGGPLHAHQPLRQTDEEWSLPVEPEPSQPGELCCWQSLISAWHSSQVSRELCQAYQLHVDGRLHEQMLPSRSMHQPMRDCAAGTLKLEGLPGDSPNGIALCNGARQNGTAAHQWAPAKSVQLADL